MLYYLFEYLEKQFQLPGATLFGFLTILKKSDIVMLRATPNIITASVKFRKNKLSESKFNLMESSSCCISILKVIKLLSLRFINT